MIIDIITSIVLVTAAIAIVAYLGILANRYLNSVTEIEADSYLISRKGQKPISFTDALDANRYLENAREQRIYFDVYVVSNGAISYVGSSKHILLT